MAEASLGPCLPEDGGHPRLPAILRAVDVGIRWVLVRVLLLDRVRVLVLIVTGHVTGNVTRRVSMLTTLATMITAFAIGTLARRVAVVLRLPVPQPRREPLDEAQSSIQREELC